MIQSALLLAPSQPTQQSPGSAGLTPGSDSTFSTIFNQTIGSRLQSDEKGQAKPNSQTPNTNAAADKKQSEQHDTRTANPQGETQPELPSLPQPDNHVSRQDALPIIDLSAGNGLTAPAATMFNPDATFTTGTTVPGQSAGHALGTTPPGDGISTIPGMALQPGTDGAASQPVNASGPAQPAYQQRAFHGQPPPAALTAGSGANGGGSGTTATDTVPFRSPDSLRSRGTADLALDQPSNLRPIGHTAGKDAAADVSAGALRQHQVPAGDSPTAAVPSGTHTFHNQPGPNEHFQAERPAVPAFAPRPDQASQTSAEIHTLLKGQPDSLTAAVGLASPTGSNPAATALVAAAAGYQPVPATTLPGTVIGEQQMDAVVTLSGYSASLRGQSMAGGSSTRDQATGSLPVTAGAEGLLPLPGETPAVRMPGFNHQGSGADTAILGTTSGATTAPYGSPSLSSYETAPLMVSLHQLTNLKSAAVDSRDSVQNVPPQPLRQQFREHLLAGKMESATSDGKNQQSPQQESVSSPQFLAPQSLTSQAGEQSYTFSQVSQGVLQQGAPQAAPAPPQPIAVSPQPPTLHDDTVFNQVGERFLLQMRNQETRLNIQLHPAELGKLDINLTVKEGAIRAHVVAQSGQVQEILERNMNRLRGILEGQGFSIEEILISTRSESIDNSGLFGEQFSRQQTSDDTNSQNSDTDFRETLESVVTTSGSTTTRVNITA